MLSTCAVAALLLTLAEAGDIKLATFDGTEKTTVSWRDTNDPVMGGASKSTFEVTAAKTGLFNGTVAIVSFLHAPGFSKITGTRSGYTFADITGFDKITLRVKSSTPNYKGFKIEFAAPGIPKTSTFSGGSYKADFNLSATSDWQLVEVPFTQFSYDHSDYTGRCDTKDPMSVFHPMGQQHYCCDKSGLQPSKPEVCVDSKYLNQIDSLGVWAEGVAGDFNIEIEWIGASKSSAIVV
jgi:hypothetical protein